MNPKHNLTRKLNPAAAVFAVRFANQLSTLTLPGVGRVGNKRILGQGSGLVGNEGIYYKQGLYYVRGLSRDNILFFTSNHE